MNRKHQGALAEIIATAWLLKEGYEVFRNVSSHGLIDIVAIRADEILRLDVKTIKVGETRPRLSQDQIDHGVKLLIADTQTGICRIEYSPIARAATIPISCLECQKPIPRAKLSQKFCSNGRCRNRFHFSRRRKARETAQGLVILASGLVG